MSNHAVTSRAVALCLLFTLLPGSLPASGEESAPATLRQLNTGESASTQAVLTAGLEEGNKKARRLASEWEQGMGRFQEEFRSLHKGDWWDKLVEYLMAESEPPKPPFSRKQLARIPRPLGKFLLELLYGTWEGVRDQISEGDFDSAHRNVAEMERIVKHIRMNVGSAGPWVKVTIPQYRDALGDLRDFLHDWRGRLDQPASSSGLEEGEGETRRQFMRQMMAVGIALPIEVRRDFQERLNAQAGLEQAA